MRYAIISDVHGNIDALEKVLEDIEKNNVDKIICLGDLVGGAPFSEEVVEKAIEINPICVRGNREGYVIDGVPEIVHDTHKSSPSQKFRYKLLKNQLSEKSMEYICNLPKELIIEDEFKNTIYISHYPLKENGKYKRHIKEPTLEEAQMLFEDKSCTINLFGHTHRSLNLKDEINSKIYANPGALGCPEDGNVAKYGILETYEDKKKNIFILKTVEYNVEEVKEKLNKTKTLGYKKVLDLFFEKQRA